MKIDMSGFDHPWLVIAATRYSLGRKTIAACAFAGDLAASWDRIPASVQDVIRLDVEDAFREADEHPARWDQCDRESWEKVRRQWA